MNIHSFPKFKDIMKENFKDKNYIISWLQITIDDYKTTGDIDELIEDLKYFIEFIQKA